MDKNDFLKRVREASKNRKVVETPKLDCGVVSAMLEGGAKDAFVKNFTSNHGIVVEDFDALVRVLKDNGCKIGVVDAKMDSTLGLEKHFEITREFDRNIPDAYHFGVSIASKAIGESGSMILKDKDTDDRLTTVAPWVHVAVLKESDIVSTLSDGLDGIIDNAYSIFVGAPSKTSDIEGVLVEGVHGPGVEICYIVK